MPGAESSAGPNIVPTHAGKYTACGSPAGAGRCLDAPPAGISAEYRGMVSVPNTLRASLFGARTTPIGTLRAASSARPAPRLTAPQFRAARFQAALVNGPASRARRRLTRVAVLMSTGHAVWHRPSTAQVWTAA